MEIRIIGTPEEYEAIETITRELRLLLHVYSERDLPRQKGPGTRRYLKAKAYETSRSSRKQD